MEFYRAQLKGEPLGWVDKEKRLMLVTDKDGVDVVREGWFGYDPCDLYLVEGEVVESRYETYEMPDGQVVKIFVPIVRANTVQKIGTLTYGPKVEYDELDKNAVQIYGLRVRIDDIPYFLERCDVPEHILRFLVKVFTERNPDRDSLSLLWGYVSEHQKLSEEFMDEFAPYLSWYYISEYQKLSPGFAAKHIDKITEEIFRNPCYESYPDSLKLLLQQKFGRSQLGQPDYSVTWPSQRFGIGQTIAYNWDVFGNGSLVVTVQRKPSPIIRAALKILLGSKWSPTT